MRAPSTRCFCASRSWWLDGWPFSSPTDSRRCAWPTASSCCATARWKSKDHTTSCSPARDSTKSCSRCRRPVADRDDLRLQLNGCQILVGQLPVLSSKRHDVFDSQRACAPLITGPRSVALALRIQVLPEPAERLAPPQPLILRLADPMPFIREIDQPTGNTLPLQRRQKRQPLRVGHAIIQLADNNEVRSVEIRGEKVRRPATVNRVHRCPVPIRATELPVAKPDLLG